MTPGTVAMRGDRLYVVLAGRDGRFAVAPLSLDRDRRRAGDVSVQAGSFGAATALCSAASVEAGTWTITGTVITQAELVACQAAAARANEERSLDRFRPLASFEAAKPSFRSGGRRVGGAAAGA